MVTKLIFLTLSLFFLQLLTKSVIVLVNRNLLFTNEETVIEQKGVLIMKKNWQEPCIAELTMKATETETYHLGGHPSATTIPDVFDSMSGETGSVTPSPSTNPDKPGSGGKFPWWPWWPW